MAVTYAQEVTGRGATTVAAGSGDFERTWIVQCDSATDNSGTIEQSGVLPLHGSTLPGNFQASLRSYSYDDSNGPWTWRVTGQYSTRQDSISKKDAREIPIPWYRPAVISCVANETQEEIAIDAAGFAILNSAYAPYKPGPTVSNFRASIFVRKAVPAVPSWFFTLPKFTNNATVQITLPTGSFPACEAGTLLFVPKELSEIKYEGGDFSYVYQEVAFELRYDPDKWQFKPLDSGSFYWDSSEIKNFVTDGAIDPKGLLDGAGGKLSVAGPPTPPTPVYFDGIGGNPDPYERYNQADFTVLPLS